MIYVVLVIATVLTVFWFALLWKVTRDDWIAATYYRVLDNIALIKRMRIKDDLRRDRLSQYGNSPSLVLNYFLSSCLKKRISKIEQKNQHLQRGNLGNMSLFAMPGYVLARKFDAIGRGGIHKNIITKSCELYGKKYASYIAMHLLARLLSYPVIGVAVSFSIGALLIAMGSETAGYAILGIGSILILVLVYAMYDELSDRVKKRRSAISKQFPNVVSKLALLVTSGMIMDRAWKETAYSQETELYQEMRKTSEELDNLVSPESAYGSFIIRCNTKETAKLASAILQNLSKGNAEIGKLLKDMAREAWLERRHTAKRDAEKANSRLMIPTMLLFLTILVMLMVPIALNFSNL